MRSAAGFHRTIEPSAPAAMIASPAAITNCSGSNCRSSMTVSDLRGRLIPPRHREQVRAHAEERRLGLEPAERGEQDGPPLLVGEARVQIWQKPAGALHG